MISKVMDQLPARGLIEVWPGLRIGQGWCGDLQLDGRVVKAIESNSRDLYFAFSQNGWQSVTFLVTWSLCHV